MLLLGRVGRVEVIFISKLIPKARVWKAGKGVGGGGPDPAFPLLFHENPKSCTFFHRHPESHFFFPEKYIKKSFPQELIVRSDVRIGPFE